MLKILSSLLSLFIMHITPAAYAGEDQLHSAKSYIRTPSGYLMVLHQGDNVFERLKTLAREEQVPSASFSGLGFVKVKFGFWDAQKKAYMPKDIEDVELASMNGSIAWKDQQPSLHAHGVVADRDFQTFGGHILDLVVSTGSVEITITVHDKKLQRTHDDRLGADVLGL